MKRLVFSIAFLHFLPFSVSLAQTPRTLESGYLAQMEPLVGSVWDESVILHASLLLKPNDAFNAPNLKVAVEILVDTRGRVQGAAVVSPSGHEPFDQTAQDALSNLRLPPPPADLVSDDGFVHVFWTLSRTAPHSSAKNAQIRYVRFTPEKAIAAYLQGGMIQKAWKRLWETEQAGTLARPSLEAFLQHYLIRFHPPQTLPADRAQAFSSLVFWEHLPENLRLLYADTLVDEKSFAAWVNQLSGENPSLLCPLFETLETKMPARAQFVFEVLMERPSFPCGAGLARRAAGSSLASLKALARALEWRSSAAIPESDRKDWTARKGDDLLLALKMIRLSRRVEFFDSVSALYASQTEPAVQAEVVRVLGALGHEQSMARILSAMRHKSPVVRRAAVQAMADYDAPDRLKRVKAGIWELDGLAKKDPDADVRRAAAVAIVKLACLDLRNENNKNYFAMMLREKNPEILAAMVAVIPPDSELARKKLIAFLSHEDARVRLAAAARLRPLRQDPAVREAFRPWLASEDPNLRQQAFFAAPDIAELLRGIEKMPFAMRVRCAYEVALRDSRPLAELLSRAPVSDDPRDLFERLPYLFGMLANAR